MADSALPAERRDALLAVAVHCTVHNTLTGPPTIDIALANTPSAAGRATPSPGAVTQMPEVWLEVASGEISTWSRTRAVHLAYVRRRSPGRCRMTRQLDELAEAKVAAKRQLPS
jgi:hypothetical protein